MCCIFSTSMGHLHHSLHEIKASLLGKFSRFLCIDDDSKLRKSLHPRLHLFPATDAAYSVRCSRKMTSDLHQILILPPAFTCFSDHLPSKYLSSYFKRLRQKKNAMHRYKKNEAVAFTSYSLCSYALIEEKWGIEKRSLAIVQRNNNICTRTFRQKKTNHVFHSGDGEQNGMTEFYLVSPSPARLTRSSVP